MSEFQLIITAVGVLFGGLTVAGSGIGAYIAVTARLARLEAEYQAHMEFFHKKGA